MDFDYRTIWWEKVPTAVQCVEKVKELILNGKSISFDNGMGEWTDSFLQSVISAVTSENYNIGFENLDLSELSDSSTITDGIADYYGIGYMTQRKISELMPELPPDGTFWILRNVNESRERELEKLLRHIKENHAPLMFLFQRTGETRIRGVENVTITPNRLDLSYFAWTLLLGNFPEEMIEYAVDLAVELSDENPVECARLCQNMNNCIRNPISFCDEMEEAQAISKVHTAQVRIIEPLIEYGRVYLIRKLGKRVEDLLPFTDDYQNVLTKPVEVELRCIIYYKFELNLSPEEKDLANMLYNARNKVSHLELLSYKEIDEIVKESRKWSG